MMQFPIPNNETSKLVSNCFLLTKANFTTIWSLVNNS